MGDAQYVISPGRVSDMERRLDAGDVSLAEIAVHNHASVAFRPVCGRCRRRE